MPSQFGTVYEKVQTTTADFTYSSGTSVAGVTTSLTGVANTPVVVINATAPFITGTGTGVFNIKYRVVTFA